MRCLELLTRAEILEVLRRLGIEEPDDDPLIVELVNQAANRPGLAVTLGSLWLRGDYDEVLTGRAVYGSLVPALRRVLEQDPTQLLAAFALGGGGGMGLAAVAEFLGDRVGAVWETVVRLGDSGVLAERGRDEAGEAVLEVIPSALRSALLHEVFFSPPSRPWGQLLGRAPSLGSAIGTLLEAAHRGVPVPRPELQRLLAEEASPGLWRDFAVLGEAEGRWVLEHYRRPIAEIAEAVLEAAPRRAIRRLLEEAERVEDSSPPVASSPLGILRHWIEEDPPEVEQSMRRRRALVDAALERLGEGGGSPVALRAALLALAPRVERTRASAVSATLVLRHGSLPASVVPEMLNLWERVRAAMPDLDLESWRELDDGLHWWIHPNRPRADLGEEELEAFHRMARRVLEDLVPFAEGRPGLASALRDRAEELGLELDLPADRDFEVLYPGWSRLTSSRDTDSRQARRAAAAAARELAGKWARCAPGEVIDALARYAEEARWSHGSGGVISDFEMALARQVEAPGDWLRTLLDKGTRPTLGSLLLSRVGEARSPGWEGLLERSLRSGEYAWDAARAVLHLSEPPEALLELALDVAEPQVVETASLQGGYRSRPSAGS